MANRKTFDVMSKRLEALPASVREDADFLTAQRNLEDARVLMAQEEAARLAAKDSLRLVDLLSAKLTNKGVAETPVAKTAQETAPEPTKAKVSAAKKH